MNENTVQNYNTLKPESFPEVWKLISAAFGRAWQEELISQFKRGPVRVDDLHEDVTLEQGTDELWLEIRATLSHETMDYLMDELQERGSLAREGGTLTGLGQYAEMPLTESEERAYVKLSTSFGRCMTAIGLTRKMKNSGLGTDQVQGVLEDLVTKGYVEVVDEAETTTTLYRAL